MKTFKDYVNTDREIFINFNEFADNHLINGLEILCIIDEDINKERKLNKESQNFNGVFTDTISLFIKEEGLKVQPAIGELMTIDQERYIVINIASNVGILEIELSRNEY